MKKIMFSDKFCQTAAVLAGTMTQIRRIITGVLPEIQELRVMNDVCEYKDPYTKKWYKCNYKHQPKYKVGDVVAVAQSYFDIKTSANSYRTPLWDGYKEWHAFLDTLPKSGAGYYNKMNTRAEFMPWRILIDNVRVERLQDISDTDCLTEGILKEHVRIEYDEPQDTVLYSFPNSKKLKPMPKTSLAGYFDNPKAACAALIDAISGKGTYEANPWVFCYTFKLVK